MVQADPTAANRRFMVHAAHEGPHHGRAVEELSFEAAAVAFVEDWSPAVDSDGEVSVVVIDQADGRRHCFRIDAATGETGPCD